jgi:hypothetical protein
MAVALRAIVTSAALEERPMNELFVLPLSACPAIAPFSEDAHEEVLFAW